MEEKLRSGVGVGGLIPESFAPFFWFFLFCSSTPYDLTFPVLFGGWMTFFRLFAFGDGSSGERGWVDDGAVVEK